MKSRTSSPGVSARLRLWRADYRRFARSRGFVGRLDDAAFFRRAFVESWAAPGFHRFWRAWNPGIAYFGHRLFLWFGGRRRWALPLVASFTANGLAHTLVVAPLLGHWSWSVIVAFTGFGLATVVSRRLAHRLRQDRWPRPLNALVNLGLICGIFELGFRADAALGSC